MDDIPTNIDETLSADTTLPTSVDWRLKNVVPFVKNQGACGSCYAFSALNAIESAIAIKTGKLHNLSEQQVVDCTRGYGNYGCSGGWMNNVFSYAMNTHLMNETTYPYTGKQSITCK